MTEQAFISITELSRRIGVPATALRYWQKEFKGVIKPTTGAGGRRYYRAADIAACEQIRDLLYTEKYTIAGVKKLLKENAVSGNVRHVSTKQRLNNRADGAPVAIMSDTTITAKSNQIPDKSTVQVFQNNTMLDTALSFLSAARDELG